MLVSDFATGPKVEVKILLKHLNHFNRLDKGILCFYIYIHMEKASKSPKSPFHAIKHVIP